MFAKRRLSGTPYLFAVSLLAAFAIPVLAGAHPGPPAHAAAKQKTCKNPDPDTPGGKPPVFIRVNGVSCSTATTLAKKVIHEAPKGCMKHSDALHARLTKPCRASGYRCTARSLFAWRALEATCKRGAKVVRFQAQA
jgi:hypothetical protein